MRRTVLCCMLALAGCFDFSRFDHVPDAATDVLFTEPFDTTFARWSPGETPTSVFTIDTGTKIEGAGALAIDATQVTVAEPGLLKWVGSTLPSTNGSRHLRFYMRYEGELDQNANIAVLTDPDGNGVDITLATHADTPASQGADVTVNVFGSAVTNSFTLTGVLVKSDDWHCYELGIEQVGGGASWRTTLSLDGMPQPMETLDTNLPAQLVNVSVGFDPALVDPTGATKAWIDVVEFTDDANTIGCPYLL